MRIQPAPGAPLRSAWRHARRVLALIGVSAASGAAGTAALADAPDAALKAAFLYNFALYSEWPALGPDFEFCAIGKDGLGESLDALTRKAIAGRAVRVRHLENNDVPDTCNVLFVSANEAARLAKLLPALAGRPVLTVAENESETATGTMLRLTHEQGRLTFDASPGAARAAGLNFSAKLLRLARRVN